MNNPIRNASRALQIAAALFYGAACGGNTKSVVAPPAVTVYTLQTIDGGSLPHEVDRSTDGAFTAVTLDMTLTIVGDGTWRTVEHRVATLNGVSQTQTRNGNGVYAFTGASATLRSENGDVEWTGTFTPSAFTLTNRLAQVFVFSK
ncbi:MAG: hypothetical protein ACJ79K_02610 [Gemmatimonadaceae bacterium]